MPSQRAPRGASCFVGFGHLKIIQDRIVGTRNMYQNSTNMHGPPFPTKTPPPPTRQPNGRQDMLQNCCFFTFALRSSLQTRLHIDASYIDNLPNYLSLEELCFVSGQTQTSPVNVVRHIHSRKPASPVQHGVRTTTRPTFDAVRILSRHNCRRTIGTLRFRSHERAAQG